MEDLPGAGQSESAADGRVLSRRTRRLGAACRHPKTGPAGHPLTLRDAVRAMAKPARFWVGQAMASPR